MIESDFAVPYGYSKEDGIFKDNEMLHSLFMRDDIIAINIHEYSLALDSDSNLILIPISKFDSKAPNSESDPVSESSLKLNLNLSLMPMNIHVC